MQKVKLVVIITLNYNQSKMTLDCVDSILKSTYTNYKLIVVDNGSNKEEYNYLLKNIDSRVLIKRIENNCGYVGGINYGLNVGSRLNPEYFLIMNNDTVLDENAITNLVEAGEKHTKKAIVSGKVYHFDRPNILQYTGSYFLNRKYLKESYPGKNEEDKGQFDVESERDMLDDIFWLLPKNIYNEIGPYSNNFFLYCEQADYALQAVRKGFKLIYTPNAKIWHKGSITTGDGNRLSPAVNYWRKKGGLIYLYRNTEKKYFYLNLMKNVSKLFVKNVLNYLGLRKVRDKKSEYAALLGYFHGLLWVVNKKPDNGYNPFLK